MGVASVQEDLGKVGTSVPQRGTDHVHPKGRGSL